MMVRIYNFLVICMFLLFSVGSFSGCSEPEKHDDSIFLIKTPLMNITSADFAEELDLKRAAYPYNIGENPAEYNEMVIHLVKILSEEMVLLCEAAQKGVTVSDEELTDAEAEFKKDYPEDSFEQMLLTNAIPYDFWKKRFKRNMIMEKLVEQELTQKIEITSQDIVQFYNELNAQGNSKKSEDKTPDADYKVDSETELVSRLRMKKTQEQYDRWIQDLWSQCPVEVNKEELRTFLIELENSKGSKNETQN